VAAPATVKGQAMFKEELRDLTQRTPGARGALIMGLDGISVEKFVAGEGINLEVFSAEYLSLVKKTLDTNRELGLGRVKELTVFTEAMIAIIEAVTAEYFIVFALPPDGNFGRARYEIHKSALRLARELS
jgi:predicted regulator of Ras-like GTPase activity (Roadblock/LC7/MglB family)